MPANKFATMLHRNTNKITLILVYAVLEWVLILLLLLNSLFSYLIIKFADYFGLRRPCLWCSRLDHIFEPTEFHNPYRSLVCETHAAEISKLAYCSNHRKLAESQDMCEDCSSSSHCQFSLKFAFFPWMKQLGVLQDCSGDKVSEKGEIDIKCSCCGAGLDPKLYYHDYYLFKPSWEDSDHIQIGNFLLESGVLDKVAEDHSDGSRSGLGDDPCEEKQGTHRNRGIQVENEAEEAVKNHSCPLPNFDCKEMIADHHDIEDFVMELEREPVKKDSLNVSAVNDSSNDQPAMAQIGCSKGVPTETQPKHLEFYIDQDNCHLIPIELMETSAKEKNIPNSYGNGEENNCGNEDFVLEFDKQVGALYELVVEDRINLEEDVPLLSFDSEEGSNIVMVESREIVEDDSSIGLPQDCDTGKEDFILVGIDETAQAPSTDGNDVRKSLQTIGEEVELDENQVSDEGLHMQHDEIEADVGLHMQHDEIEADVGLQMQHDEIEVDVGLQMPNDEFEADIGLQLQNDEFEADVSIGTEIPDHEPIDDLQTQEGLSYPSIQDDLSTSNGNDHDYDYAGPNEADDNEVEFKTITIETTRETMMKSHLSLCSESNEVEEDKIPDTPTSVDSFHYLHKKLLLLDRRESGTEESLDGSVISDIEAGDVTLTVEKLKSALRSERKALNALYAELEEERSASAVAANQTMAMINRLQEEKAAMQMEALQYQRMMEEQSEYDQEALQILNELMVKREKEKAELEKELEILRMKVQDYETKEKMMLLKRMKEGSTRSVTCSASCSNSEDCDGISVDLNHEGKDEDGFENHQESSNRNTPADLVLSLDNFEEERLSILEQLKVLEEKLVTLSDGEEQHFQDIKPVEHLYEENGNGHTDDFNRSREGNEVANGHYKGMNGKCHYQERKNIGAKAKRLLPLFDATDAETEDGLLNGHEEMFDPVAELKSADNGGSKLAIEEEIDHVYERLHALEADREFLRHCVASLGKGDKGLELLQEILHHLRDLRSVELRVRNMEDGIL